MRMRTLLTSLATTTAVTGSPALAAPAPPASPPPTAPGVADTSNGQGSTHVVASPMADPSVAPGGNFDLSVWQLQEPVGSPGSPTTIPSSRLQGANGFQDAYFYTDTRDGAMTFWAPEKGVTTPNSNYAQK